LWPMVEGYWQEPLKLDFAGEKAQTKSLDHELRQSLDASVANARTDGRRVDDLAIFSRWYYSSWRDGQWFPFRMLADLNFRKLVRDVSNLVKADSCFPVQ
jgi:excinuclease ABC subunit C